MIIFKPAHNGAQEGLMNGTPDQQKITINVTKCISWTPRSIEFAKTSKFFKCSATVLTSNHGTVADIDIIKLNKGKGRESSKHLQILEQLCKVFKDTTDAVISRVATPTAYCAHCTHCITLTCIQGHSKNDTKYPSAPHSQQYSNHAHRTTN